METKETACWRWSTMSFSSHSQASSFSRRQLNSYSKSCHRSRLFQQVRCIFNFVYFSVELWIRTSWGCDRWPSCFLGRCLSTFGTHCWFVELCQLNIQRSWNRWAALLGSVFAIFVLLQEWSQCFLGPCLECCRCLCRLWLNGWSGLRRKRARNLEMCLICAGFWTLDFRIVSFVGGRVGACEALILWRWRVDLHSCLSAHPDLQRSCSWSLQSCSVELVA